MELDSGHRLCAYEAGLWNEWVEKPSNSFVYNLFFRYFVIENKAGGSRYFERRNRLDPIFDWICFNVEKYLGGLHGKKN